MSKIAFVLSGGGTKGAYQAGVLKKLEELGHVPDRIYGASIGALNAMGFSYGNADTLMDFWKSIKCRQDALKFNWNALSLRQLFVRIVPSIILFKVLLGNF